MYLETFVAMLESSKAETGIGYIRKNNADGTITIVLDISKWADQDWTFNKDGELIKIETGMVG